MTCTELGHAHRFAFDSDGLAMRCTACGAHREVADAPVGPCWRCARAIDDGLYVRVRLEGRKVVNVCDACMEAAA